jgi:hypothetical protein
MEKSSGTNEVPFISLKSSTPTAEKGLPHSKQLAFDRDVINPHDGHILCD